MLTHRCLMSSLVTHDGQKSVIIVQKSLTHIYPIVGIKTYDPSPLSIFVRAAAPVTGAAPAVSEDKWSIRQLLNSLHLFFPPGHSLASSSAAQRDFICWKPECWRPFWSVVFMMDYSWNCSMCLKTPFTHPFLYEVLNTSFLRNDKRGHLSMLY